MFTDQCISVSALRQNINTYIEDVKNWPKIIFINNKPVAVLTSIDNYDININQKFSFDFNPPLNPKDVLSHFGRTTK